VAVGAKIKDTATLTGLVKASGGEVTFKLYADSNCATKPVFESSATVSGSGTVKVSSTEFTTTATGTFYWTAEYSGDTNNKPIAVSKCGESGETSMVFQRTGALTMGFWQNKNGQGIISGANQTKLGEWLRKFHPFSDAPSTKDAAYVYNIIKGATCGGTTCNAMLRAQMLATALDVYFSDPALGGNKIGAFTGLGAKEPIIGSIVINLTKLCVEGNPGSCSGKFEDVSSAFGGATSMTVLEMLEYQNTSDPLKDAGAVWYKQEKAKQVLAKDAFDAINNNFAF
jgi:hypothetical protein